MDDIHGNSLGVHDKKISLDIDSATIDSATLGSNTIDSSTIDSATINSATIDSATFDSATLVRCSTPPLTNELGSADANLTVHVGLADVDSALAPTSFTYQARAGRPRPRQAKPPVAVRMGPSGAGAARWC